MKEQRRDQYMRYDVDEPFWTSNAKIVRGNNNSKGDIGTARTASQMPTYPDYMADQGCGGAIPIVSGWPTVLGYCHILVNYTLRFHKPFITYSRDVSLGHKPYNLHPAAIKMEEYPKLGLVADNLNWRYFERPGAGSWWSPSAAWPAREQVYEAMKDYTITNHDHSYNVLFSSGTVKTYNDGGKHVYRAMCEAFRHSPNSQAVSEELYLRKDSTDLTTVLNHFVWTPYLDESYAQD